MLSKEEQFLEAFLNDHFHDHRTVDPIFYDKVFKLKQFHYQGSAYRGCISSLENFSYDLNQQKYKSWSQSLGGIKSFVTNELIDGAFIDESSNETFIIKKAQIVGIDIAKICLCLKEKGSDLEFLNHLMAEQEVILMDFINYETEDFSMLESRIVSFLMGDSLDI